MRYALLLRRWAGIGLGVFVLIQFVPYGHAHDNPRVTKDVGWSSAEARDLARRACYDCHSNEAKWPWYSNIAPVSWLVQRDVDKGRKRVNFSEWDKEWPGTQSLSTAVEKHKMPFPPYLIIHSEARLTEAERKKLIEALSSIEDNEPTTGNE